MSQEEKEEQELALAIAASLSDSQSSDEPTQPAGAWSDTVETLSESDADMDPNDASEESDFDAASDEDEYEDNAAADDDDADDDDDDDDDVDDEDDDDYPDRSSGGSNSSEETGSPAILTIQDRIDDCLAVRTHRTRPRTRKRTQLERAFV